MKSSVLIFIFALMSSISAQALWIIQPRVSYLSGTYELSGLTAAGAANGSTESKATTSGGLFGTQINYFFGRTFLGIEADVGTVTLKSVSTQNPTTGTQVNGYLILGVSLGFPDIYIGYGASETFSYEVGTSKVKISGTGVKLGIDYKFMNRFMIFTEYEVSTPTQSDLTIGSVSSSSKLKDSYEVRKQTQGVVGFGYNF